MRMFKVLCIILLFTNIDLYANSEKSAVKPSNIDALVNFMTISYKNNKPNLLEKIFGLSHAKKKSIEQDAKMIKSLHSSQINTGMNTIWGNIFNKSIETNEKHLKELMEQLKGLEKENGSRKQKESAKKIILDIESAHQALVKSTAEGVIVASSEIVSKGLDTLNSVEKELLQLAKIFHVEDMEFIKKLQENEKRSKKRQTHENKIKKQTKILNDFIKTANTLKDQESARKFVLNMGKAYKALNKSRMEVYTKYTETIDAIINAEKALLEVADRFDVADMEIIKELQQEKKDCLRTFVAPSILI